MHAMVTYPIGRFNQLLFSFFLMLFFHTSVAQENWIKTLNQEGKHKFPNTLIANQLGNILVAGSQWSDDAPQPFITSLNIQGQHLWTKVLDINGHIWEMIELESGDIAALYSLYDGISNDYSGYYLMRLSSDGTPLWSIWIKEYTVAPPSIIALSNDIAILYASVNTFDQYLIRLDSSGQTVWSKCIRNDLITRGSNLMNTTGGGLAFQYAALGGEDMIIKIDGEGILQWVRSTTLASLAPYLEYANGDLLYTGYSSGSQTDNNCFVRSHADGTIVWSRQIHSPYDFNFLASPILLNDGSVLISIENPENFKGGLLKIDPLGNAEWIKMLLHFSTRHFSHLAKTSNQSIFLLQNQLLTPVSPIIRTNPLGELEQCEFEDICYATQELPLSFQENAIELIDTNITFSSFSSILFTTDTTNLVDLCPECPFPSSFFIAPDTLCVGDSFQPEVPCNGGAAGYAWLMEGATPTSSVFPVPSDVCYDLPGTYTITRIINTATCPDTFSRTIVVIDAPTYDIPEDTLLCNPLPFVLDISQPHPVDYLWENGSNSPKREILNSGNYSVTIADRFCGAKTMDIDLSFLDDFYLEPPIYLGEDTMICQQSPLTLDAFHPDASGWSWQDGANKPIRSINSAGTYIISAWVQNCLVSDTISITVKDCAAEIYIPTAFSPNADGINDYFFPQGDGFELIQIKVFNRWGSTVFEGNTNSPRWDGQINGQPATPGTYAYVAKFYESATGNRLVRQGDVLLVR